MLAGSTLPLKAQAAQQQETFRE